MNQQELRKLLSEESSISEMIEKLKGGCTARDLKTDKDQFIVSKHDTMNEVKRPDKKVLDSAGNLKRVEKVNRIAIALQELIAERAVSFLFGNDVEIHCTPETDKQKQVLAALKRVLKDNKINSFNSEIALEMFRSTEVAECWFPVEKAESHEDYGFKTKFKLRVMAFNPWDGNELYPLFDETGDLIAFSRYFEMKEEGKQVKYFETYTADEKITWKDTGGGWLETGRADNPIKKIPVVYGRQTAVEWANVQNLIDRLEKLLSNYGDTNDYHAAPTIFVKGDIQGWGQKGESGRIVQGKGDATAEYLSWNQAPEMVKLEIETLFRMIYSLSQTPDISFDAVKGIGDISGVALKLLFLDAHLKVKKKQRVFDAYLERRTNIIKAYISYMNTNLSSEANALNIDAKIHPFMIDDLKAMIDLLSSATGGKAVLSQKTAVAQSGLTENVEEEYKQIQKETEEARATSVFETAI